MSATPDSLRCRRVFGTFGTPKPPPPSQNHFRYLIFVCSLSCKLVPREHPELTFPRFLSGKLRSAFPFGLPGSGGVAWVATLLWMLTARRFLLKSVPAELRSTKLRVFTARRFLPGKLRSAYVQQDFRRLTRTSPPRGLCLRSWSAELITTKLRDHAFSRFVPKKIRSRHVSTPFQLSFES